MRYETVSDIVEDICDRAGFYSDKRCDRRHDLDDEDPEWLPEDDHETDCLCRVVVVPDWTTRLRAALVTEQKLRSAGLL